MFSGVNSCWAVKKKQTPEQVKIVYLTLLEKHALELGVLRQRALVTKELGLPVEEELDAPQLLLDMLERRLVWVHRLLTRDVNAHRCSGPGYSRGRRIDA